MSSSFITADFYQYQIITLLRFQTGGRATFLRGDAGQAISKQTNVSCCSGSTSRETSGHTGAPHGPPLLWPSALLVTSALFVLSVTSRGSRKRRSSHVGVITYSYRWADTSTLPWAAAGSSQLLVTNLLLFSLSFFHVVIDTINEGPRASGCQMTEGATRERRHLRETKQGFWSIDTLISNTFASLDLKYLSDLPH